MLNLFIKDIKNTVYDRKSLMILLVMPIILMMILGSALQGTFTDESGIKDIHIGIVKEYNREMDIKKFIKTVEQFDIDAEIDSTDYNPEDIFFNQFLGGESVEFLKYSVISREEGEKQLNDNKIDALVILPENFVYDSYVNMYTPLRNKMTVTIIKNPESSFNSNIVDQVIKSYKEMTNMLTSRSSLVIQYAQKNDVSTDIIGETIISDDETFLNTSLIETKDISGKEPISSFQYYSAAIMCMFLLYAASIGGKALLEEKRDYTVQRMHVIGVGTYKIAASNMFRIIAITVIQIMITILFTSIVLGVDWGDGMTVIIGSVLTAFAIGGIGMFVSVLTYIFDKQQIASLFETVIIQIMALIGGSFIPVEILPKFIQKISIFSVNGSALKIFTNAMYHEPIQENYLYMSVLAAVTIIFIGASYILLMIKQRRGVL